MKYARFAFALGLLLITGTVLLGGPAEAAILRVPENYLTIQGAIDVATAGDTVEVNDGYYYDNINFNGKAITVRSVNGKETTTIDGNFNGTVVWISGTGTLSGFTLKNGIGVRDGSYWRGGGIYCLGGSPTIEDCDITGNTADGGYGGGIYVKTGTARIENCDIYGNTAYYQGGGIATYQSEPTIVNCTIRDNISGNTGGGVYFWYGSPVMTDSKITGNKCIINDHLTGTGGGVSFGPNSTAKISGCSITGNQASNGGGIHSSNNSAPEITNCLITGNSAGNGGGIRCYASTPTIKNTTISDNGNGGGFVCDSCSPIIVNSILYYNYPEEIIVLSGDPNVTYSNVQGGYRGRGNMNEAPQFTGQGADPYSLSSMSPSIDAGTNKDAPSDDILGVSRPQDGDAVGKAVVDMGAYEYFICTTQEQGAQCTDGFDNDCDGLADDADADCLCVMTESPEVSCDDGIDNDCDEWTDCEDTADCSADPICAPADCTLYGDKTSCTADPDCRWRNKQQDCVNR